MKLRIQRHGHRLLLPIHLASAPSALELALCLAYPALTAAVMRLTWLRPLKARAQAKRLREERAAAADAAKARAALRKAAAAEGRLLEKEAAARAREEMARHG